MKDVILAFVIAGFIGTNLHLYFDKSYIHMLAFIVACISLFVLYAVYKIFFVEIGNE